MEVGETGGALRPNYLGKKSPLAAASRLLQIVPLTFEDIFFSMQILRYFAVSFRELYLKEIGIFDTVAGILGTITARSQSLSQGSETTPGALTDELSII